MSKVNESKRCFEEYVTDPYFCLSDFQIQFFNAVNQYMEANNLTKEQFAEEIGKSVRFVTQILNGTANPSYQTICEVLDVVGCYPTIKIEKRNEQDN